MPSNMPEERGFPPPDEAPVRPAPSETAPEPEILESEEALARQFHEIYERLAPQFNYATRRESAVPWLEVPEDNRQLMVAVCAELLRGRAAVGPHDEAGHHLTPQEAREFEAAKGPTTPLGERPAEDARAAIVESLHIYQRAFMENWVVEDTLDAIRAVLRRVRAGVREGPDQP